MKKFFLYCFLLLLIVGCKNTFDSVNKKTESKKISILIDSNIERSVAYPKTDNLIIQGYSIIANGVTKYKGPKSDKYEIEIEASANKIQFEIIGYSEKDANGNFITPVVYCLDEKIVETGTTSLSFTTRLITQVYTSGALNGVSQNGKVRLSIKMPDVLDSNYIVTVNSRYLDISNKFSKSCDSFPLQYTFKSGESSSHKFSVENLPLGKHTAVINVYEEDSDDEKFIYVRDYYVANNVVTNFDIDLSGEDFDSDSCTELALIRLYEAGTTTNLLTEDGGIYKANGIHTDRTYHLELTMKVEAQNFIISSKLYGELNPSEIIFESSKISTEFIDSSVSYAQKVTFEIPGNKIISLAGDSILSITVEKGSSASNYSILISQNELIEPEDVEVSHPVDVSAMTALPVPVTELTETNYVITNEAQLFALATFVKGKGETTGKTFVLGKDIKLTQDWVPIGNTTKPFEGTFEGNNYKVAGININGDFTDAGFIGRVDSAVVQNLTVEGSIVCSSGNYRTAGIITNSQGDTKILNCINQVNVTGDRHVGGILAQAETGTVIIENCINFGDITVGYSHGAGIVGYVSIGPDSVIVNNCANYGKISGDYPLAGIGFSYGNISINNCINNGNVAPNSGAAYGAIGYKSGGDLTVQHSAYLSGSAGTKTSIGSDPDPDTVSSYTHTSGKMGCTLTTAIGSTTDVKEMLNSASEIDTSYNRWIYTTNETYYGLPMFADTIARLNAEPEEPENLLKALYSSPKVLNKIPEAGKTYKISTEDDLIYLRTLTDAENQCSGVVFEQTDSITLSGINWNPIGSGVTTSKNRFSGTYDGKGFKISNLNIDTSLNYAGLFGYCFKAKIQNLIVEGQITSNANNYVGGIVAFMAGSNTDSLIENCISNVKIESSSKYVGGICGFLNYGIIRNCVNIGNITCLNDTADLYGGITGNNNTYIYNCVNLGNISGATGFGGISGTNGIKMINCYNAGTVKLNELSSSTSFGGITGASYNSSSNQNCFTKAGMCSTSYQGSTPAGSTFTDVSELITTLDGFDWDGASLDSTDYNSWNTYTYNGFPVCVDCSKVNNP